MSEKFAPWVDGLTIGEMLRQTSHRLPDNDALIFASLDKSGQEFGGPRSADCYRRTFSQFNQEVDQVARALISLGIQKGEHVAVWATNWPQWVLLQFATARIGAVMVTINPAYRASELAYVLKQSDAVALFLIDRFRRSNYFGLLNEAVGGSLDAGTTVLDETGTWSVETCPRLRHVISMNEQSTPSIPSWNRFLALAEQTSAAALAEREGQLGPHDAINIQYTSGTTGFPKGAMLSHSNILLNAWCIGDCQKLTDADRVCVPVPFYHCFGCVLGTLCCAIYGAAMILPAEHFDALATLDALELHRATALYGVPTMFIGQLEHPTFNGRDITSLRTGIMAGSPCPIELMKRVVGEMHCPEVTIAYGLTEASPVITQTRTDDPLELRVQTVGKKIPGVEVRLVDPATGEEVGDNANGELCTRGHGVMIGYYNMPEATASAIDGQGWLHSGDLALRLPNGYYKITGRIKDMICRGGENIYPREVEEFLYTHPAIQDVAVVGVPDKRYVEEVCAWIRLKPGASLTEEELRQFCKTRLSHYKVPRYVRFVDAFPQTVTGKIQKFRIRELMAEELGIHADETA